jgi:hypothetical protein
MAVLLQIQIKIMVPSNLQISSIIWGILIFLEIINAANMVGTGILLNLKYHQAKGHLQPGHWILIYSGIGGLLETIWFGIEVIMIQKGFKFISTVNTMLHVTCLISLVIIFYGIASRLPEYGRWKVLFRFWALIFLFQLIFTLFAYIYPALFNRFSGEIWKILVLQILPIVFLAVIVILDLFRGLRRDWLHWLGVWTMILCDLASFISIYLAAR